MTYPCPICGSGTVKTQVEKNYPTKVRGCEFIVAKASVERCNACGEGFFGAAELKRWREAFYKSLSDTAKIRLLGANGYGFLEGNGRADATLVKRGLIVDTGSGLMALTMIGRKVRTGLLA
jgi:YgiT-type zinc finger domain-containing protein